MALFSSYCERSYLRSYLKRYLIFCIFYFLPFMSLLAQPCATTLSGSYTIGTGGDFPTISAAASAYNNSCIDGNVTFYLISSVYTTNESFPIIFDRNNSAGPNATLTIKPAAGISTVITGSASYGALIKIQGDYVQINGSNNGTDSRNLIITNTSNTDSRVIHFASVGTDPVTYCGVSNCELINGNIDKSVVLISDAAVPSTSGYSSSITIENNNFKKAYYGIYCKLTAATLNGSGILIASNLMNNSGVNAIQHTGIYLEGVDGAMIRDNVIGNFNGTDSISDRGIWLSAGVKNTNIIGNKIGGLNYTGGKGLGAFGILIASGVANANISVSNNMIFNISGDGNDYTSAIYTLENPTGILLNSVTQQGGIRIYHNSICLGGVTGFTNTLNKPNAISSCIRLRSGSYADIRNNILVNNLGLLNNTGFGSMGILASNSASQFDQLNYNDYYVNPTGLGTKLIGHIFSSNIQASTLAAWRTASGKDLSSLNIQPIFTSQTDLHLNINANVTLDDKATFITGFNSDIDKSSRHPMQPDMGCDEFVPANTANWIGIQSADWTNPFNWEANEVPGPSVDLTIVTGFPFYPVIRNNASVRNLTLNGNSNVNLLSVDSAVQLEIYGTLTRTNGCMDASKAKISMIGNSEQTIPDAIFCNNSIGSLIVGNSSINGVNLNGPIGVTSTVEFLTNGKKLNANGYLTLKSGPEATASIGDLTGKTITGEVTVERYIPSGVAHGKSWQFLSVPLYGSQTINQAWQDSAVAPNQNRYPGYGIQLTSHISPLPPTFDVYTPAGSSIKTYNSAANSWEPVLNTLNTSISNTKGYFVFVRGDRSVITSTATSVPTILRAKGKLYTATTGELPPVTDIQANTFASIGNPYASAIDIRNISRNGGVDNVFYVWDPTLVGTRGLGGYQTISSANGYVPIPGGTINYPSGIPCTRIESGQAFFMHATASNGAVSFQEGVKIAGSKNSFRNADTIESDVQDISISLYTGATANDKMADGCSLLLDTAFSIQPDGEDAQKILNGGENLGLMRFGKLFSIVHMPHAAVGDTVKLYLNNLKKQLYEFRIRVPMPSFQHSGFLLFDQYANQQTLLEGLDTIRISFNVNDDPASYSNDRFLLISQPHNVLPLHFISVVARRNQSFIALQWKVAQAENIDAYVVLRSKDGLHFSPITDTVTVINKFQTLYQCRDEFPENERLFYKIMAIENGVNHESQVSVVEPAMHPAFNYSILSNPTKNGTVIIQFNNPINEDLSIRIVNALGQHIKKTKLLRGSQALSLSLNDWQPGTYFLCFYDLQNRLLLSEKLIAN